MSIMKIKFTFLLLILVISLSGCTKDDMIPDEEIVKLSLWGGEMDQELLNDMAREFEEYYSDEAYIQVTVCEESEKTCRDTVLFNPQTAADVYAFADDQLESMAAAGALAELDEQECQQMAEACGGVDSVAIEAASYDGVMYAYPMTASNGYFLYYNSEYISADQAESLEEILKAARDNKKKFAMDLTSGWYLYSFFKTAGMDVYVTEDGTNYCDFNSQSNPIKGVEVAEKIMDIANDEGCINAEGDAMYEGIKSGEIIAAVSGTWNEKICQEAYGEHYAAAKLPTIRYNNEDVQMHSVVGYKLIGVNAYSDELVWAKRLGQWLVNEENQLKRFEVRGEGPANKAAAAAPQVQQSYAIAALSRQTEFGHLQRVAESYWDPMYRLGNTLCAKNVDHRNMQTLLDETVKEIK